MQDNTNTYTDNTEQNIQKLVSVLSGNKNKLTDWKKEPTVDDLMHDYKAALSSHSYQISKIKGWLDQLYPKVDKNKIKQGRSGYVARTIRKLAEWRYSSLASSILNERNLFQVTASSPKYINASFQNTLVLNYQFNTLIDKVHFINSLVRTLVNEGTAIVRVGWDIEQQYKEREIPVYEYVQADEQGVMLLVQIMEQITAEQEQTGVEDSKETDTFRNAPEDLQESLIASQQYGQPVIAVDTGKKQKIKELVDTRNRPSLKVINNSDLVIDPTCEGDFSKAKFVVYRYQTDSSSLKMMNQKIPNTYHNIDKLDGEGIDVTNIGDIAAMPNEVFSELIEHGKLSDSGFKFKDEARKQITVYEYWGYWDIDGTGIAQSICATIADGKFIKLERNPFPDGELPFVVIPYLPVKESVYGEPDAELVGDNQQVIQALNRSMIDINARSANGQVAMPKGFLDIVNKQKFNRGEDYEYNPTNLHPAEAIYMHTANELPQSLLAFQQLQYAEAESITGVKSFSNGIDGNAYGQVVAGMSQAISAINQREGDIIFRISKGLEKIGNKILSMNMEWLNEEEVVSLTQFDFITIHRDELKGDFRLAVKLKSNSESEGKAQQLTFMAQTLGESADWGLRKIMLMEIGQLYNLDTFVSALKDYEPQPDPLAQKQAELEVALLEAKLQTEQAQAEYYNARSAFIDAQIGNTQADTDLKALDFMEQQEGVKHARQREIVEAQAEAQNKGKIASELLKGKNAKDLKRLDNETKRAIEKAKGSGKDDSKVNKKPLNDVDNREKARQAQESLRQLPNPELGATPRGLYTADGLGNYIRGDANR